MFMTENNFEKNLGGKMNGDLVDRFTKQVDQRSSKIKRSLAAAVKLWIELPQEVQSRLLDQSLDANSLIGLVEEIVDERMKAGRAAGSKLLGRPNKKHGRTD